MSPHTKISDSGRVDDITERLAEQLDTELFTETSELLEDQRGELVRLKAQVRWLEGKPYRSSAEKVPEGQLVLLRVTAGSGATRVNFGTPSLHNKKLTFRTTYENPRNSPMTEDMSYNCFAVAVDISKVDSVFFQYGSATPLSLELK